MEQAYRDANISFKVSNYMLLQMHNQVIIVLTNCQKQSLMQVQLPNIFLQSAALVTSLCDFETAMQMHAQAASASCIQRIWRQHLEHRRYQALRQHPRAKAWRQQSASVKAHLLQKVISGNVSLMSAFCQPKELQRCCQCMLESSIILLCSCTCMPAICACTALLLVTALLILAWQKCSVCMLWPAFVVYVRILWTKRQV